MAVQKIGLQAVLEMGDFSANLRGYINGVNQMTAQTDRAAASAAKAGPSFSSFSAAMANIGHVVVGAAQPFVSLGDAVLRFGGLAAAAAAGGVAALAAGIAGIGVASTKLAADFDAGMRNVNAIAQLPEEQFQALSDEVVNFSLTTRSSAEDLSRGLYNVVSAGQSLTETVSVPITKVKELADGSKQLYTETLNTSEGMAILQMASRAAGAGLATVDDTSRLLISALGSYGMGVEDAGRVTDLFLYAVNKGITTLPQLTNELGTVFPTAHALGISLEEVTASTVLLTRKGLSTAESTTAINQAMTGLLKPSKELSQFLKDNGYESGLAAVKALGFAGVMELLANSTGGAKEELALMFGNIRAERAVFSLATDGARELRDMVKDFGENAAGAVELARIEQYKSLQANVAKLTNAFKAIGITIGKEFLPYVIDIVKQVQPMVVAFGKKLPDAISIFKDMLSATFSGAGVPGLAAAAGIGKLGALFGIPPEITQGIANLATQIVNLAGVVRGYLITGFEYFQSTVLPALAQAFQWVIANSDSFMGALYGIGALLAGSAILAAVVSIGAALAALLNPITLIIAAAAILGAAWNANWYGMRDALTAFWYNTAQPALQELWAWLQVNVPIAIQYLSGLWTNTLLPAMQQAGIYIQTVVIPALIQAYQWLQANLPTAIQYLSNLWTNTLLPALQQAGTYIQTVVIPALVQAYQWLQANLPVAIQYLSDLWTGTLQPALVNFGAFVTGTLIPTLQQVWSWLAENIPAAIATVSGYWNSMLAAVQSVSDFFTGTVGPALNNAAAMINGVMTPAIQAEVAIWQMLGAALNATAQWINTYLMPAFTALGGFITAVFNLALTALAGLLQNVVMPAFAALGAFIQSVMQPVITAIGEALNSVATALGLVGSTATGTTNPALTLLGSALSITANVLTNVFGVAIQALVGGVLVAFQAGLQGIQNALTWVTDKLNSMTSALNNVTLPPWLQPGSPTPFELGLRGIADMLKGPVTKALTEFGGIAGPPFQVIADALGSIKVDLSSLVEEGLPAFSSAAANASGSIVGRFDAINDVLSLTASAATSAGITIANQFSQAGSKVSGLSDDMAELKDTIQEVASRASSISSAFSSFNDAGNNIYSTLIPALQSLVDWLDRVSEAAADAASNVGNVGNNAGDAGGPGFQHGANFIVPSGFGNDSFPFRAETGERVIVIPKPLASQPVAQAGGVLGGMSIIFENVVISNDMDLEMLGSFVERRVARAMGGA